MKGKVSFPTITIVLRLCNLYFSSTFSKFDPFADPLDDDYHRGRLMAQRQRVREIVIQGYVYESEFLGISRADLTPMIQSLGAKASPSRG